MRRLLIALLLLTFFAANHPSAQDISGPEVSKRISFVSELRGYRKFASLEGSWIIRVEFRDGCEPSTFSLLVGKERFNKTIVGDRFYFYYRIDNGILFAITGPHREND